MNDAQFWKNQLWGESHDIRRLIPYRNFFVWSELNKDLQIAGRRMLPNR